MSRFLRSCLGVAATVLVAAACRDIAPTGSLTDSGARSSAQASIAEQRPRPSRTDTPWRLMSDVELATKVAEAGGRVFIGFKDPEAAAGVDEMGRVLASRSSVAAAKALLRGRAVELEFEFIDMPTVIARIPSASVGELRHHALIEYIEPIFPGSYLAQDTTWNVHRVNAPDAWSSSSGSDVKLLITDSGIDNAHPDLAPAVVQSCETPPSDGIDRLFHGTAVAGIAAAVNNDAQIVGTAHGVALWSSRIGRDFPDAGFAACAVQFGRVNGVHVINLSIDVTPNTGLTDQINAAYNQDGIVIVAAAGNRNGGPVAYPATLGAVIAVSAIDTNNNFASFSAAGPQVELTAPGTTVTDQRGLTTTCLGGTVASTCAGFRVQGTSFAAPHVAAAAAILKSFNPAWTNVEIRDRLQRTAIDLALQEGTTSSVLGSSIFAPHWTSCPLRRRTSASVARR